MPDSYFDSLSVTIDFRPKILPSDGIVIMDEVTYTTSDT